MRIAPKDIDAYIANVPPDVQGILQEIRTTIQAVAPEAVETISYQMPTFKLHGILVCFAAFKKHIGFYPPAKGDAEFMQQIAPYAGPKGNLQFSLDQPIPYALIRKIVKVRMKTNLDRAAVKKLKRP